MNYFVTVDGIEVLSNLTQAQAISRAKKEYERVKSTLKVGIGRVKYVKGEKMYSCVPMHFYL